MLTGSTISGNTAEFDGGGIHVRFDDHTVAAPLTMAGSVLSDNTVIDPESQETRDVGGVFVLDANYSLIGLAAAAQVNTGGNNISDDNPQLAPLANNGGPTQTHALLPDSPAIDAGDPDFAPPPQFDQRGAPFDRVVNGRIDIGAFESSSTRVPADLIGDGFVDFDDLTRLLAHWDQVVSAGQGNLVDPLNTPVNFQDLTLLLAAWTGPGPVGAAQAAVVGGDRRVTDSVMDVAGEGSATGVASYRARHAAARSRPAGGIYRLQAVAVDRVMAGEEELPSLRRAGRTRR